MKIIIAQDGTMVNAEQISKIFPPRKENPTITYEMIIPRDNHGYAPKLASGTLENMQDLWKRLVAFMASEEKLFNIQVL